MTLTPSFVVDGPIPYVPLFSPHEGYCLTAHLPTDVHHLPAIVNQPEIKATLGYAEGHMTEEMAQKWIDNVMTGPRFVDYPYYVIRRIGDLDAPSPPIIGFFALGRENYHCFGDKRPDLIKQNSLLSPEKAQYQLTFFIDGAYQGKGLITAAGRTILRTAPHIRHFPGQLCSAYLSHNVSSQRVHRKLGFKTIAIARDVYQGHDALCDVWVGEKDCDKVGTIYSDFEVAP
nr:uncharacterized protein CI109_006687 [Kwoniella shandongensis]KAA5524963.1 hypothetical protein CI109_006687 [Kwoniella shandongensis]